MDVFAVTAGDAIGETIRFAALVDNVALNLAAVVSSHGACVVRRRHSVDRSYYYVGHRR